MDFAIREVLAFILRVSYEVDYRTIIVALNLPVAVPKSLFRLPKIESERILKYSNRRFNNSKTNNFFYRWQYYSSYYRSCPNSEYSMLLPFWISLELQRCVHTSAYVHYRFIANIERSGYRPAKISFKYLQYLVGPQLINTRHQYSWLEATQYHQSPRSPIASTGTYWRIWCKFKPQS